ncbi:MAG: ABC transporter substrate-binding protein, partial [Limnochordia bacterium]
MNKFISTFLITILFALALTGCRTSTGETAGTGELKDFVFGVYNFSKVDPADGYNGWGTIRYGIGETLFKLNDNLEVVPLLAKDYSLSGDKLSWTINLRDNVKFHNGKVMDGAAVKASLERLIQKNERAAAGLMIDTITADGFN